MWGRLSLRWQVALAVLVPSLAVALFSGFYVPKQQRTFGLKRLEDRARTVGLLASDEIAILLEQGGAVAPALPGPQPVDAREGGLRAVKQLSHIFERVDQSGAVLFQAVLAPDGKVLAERGSVPRGVKGSPEEGESCSVIHLQGNPVAFCELPGGHTYVVGMDSAGVREDAAVLLRTTLYVYLGAMVVGLFIAFFIGRAIAEPVTRMTQAAREVAQGDVSLSEVDVASAGEVRMMAHSFNEMLGTLRGTVSELLARLEQLSSASRGLTGASADQEHVISQQAAYAQQIAATFEELSRTAEQISSSTEVVESSARRTHEAVAEAMAVVAQVVAGINDIRMEAKGVADAIVGLNQDLQQVSKIAQVINQVAERSDLLALNAALEGTKAGEVGRGFSLVAAEMRKLAENVSASARDIARIVEKVQDSGNEAATKARVGMATSDRGVEVAEQASAVFQRIVELARGTSEAARQITIATRQQRQSSEQAVQGARNVAELVKQGVDATGRTTRIAQDLQNVADSLTVLTSKFKVARDR
ncbi:methyl-accepting chemotaxis protein [Vitiosangium sp. GDMCC 1.1324]|uniref:methyl-accepting chemotaxis protein n=1 Tax=Vitiosangium sp. (strain GDMCC 1.1324) TaxID=2138576 RepID=UPI000D39B31E|nr:methyl-accepting chemotaxis protein [Vitiosangium sp. GDMCC 1.1324]PTL78009.1 methyl-accepting chemotaxis protein [Vitiosangium sp. GDMCC 1.1324]